MAAENPYVNKVIYGTTVLVDLTDTTALAADVAEGKVFYGADGSRIVGTAKGGGSMTKLWENSSLSSSFAAQYVSLADDARNYDFILISYIFSTGTPDRATIIVPVSELGSTITSGGVHVHPTYSMRINAGSYNRTGARNFRAISTNTMDGPINSIYFDAASYNTNTANGYVIPAAVYGIKL